MSEFRSFSEAAVLYAQNVRLIAEMQSIFEREVNQRLDLLAEGIREYLPESARFRDQTTSLYRYWWVGPEEESRDKHARIWFLPKNAEIVTDGRLTLNVYVPDTLPGIAAAVKQSLRQPPFDAYCREPKSRWSLVVAEVQISSADDIDVSTRRIADLLNKLESIEASCQAAPGDQQT